MTFEEYARMKGWLNPDGTSRDPIFLEIAKDAWEAATKATDAAWYAVAANARAAKVKHARIMRGWIL